MNVSVFFTVFSDRCVHHYLYLPGPAFASFDRHFCPNCDWLFPEDVEVDVCERCPDGAPDTNRFDDARAPVRLCHYFALEEHIRAVFHSKALALQAKYAWNRPAPPERTIADRELEDVWDGDIMDELYHNADPRIDPQSTLYFSLSFDGVEVKKKAHSAHTPTAHTHLHAPEKVIHREIYTSTNTQPPTESDTACLSGTPCLVSSA